MLIVINSYNSIASEKASISQRQLFHNDINTGKSSQIAVSNTAERCWWPANCQQCSKQVMFLCYFVQYEDQAKFCLRQRKIGLAASAFTPSLCLNIFSCTQSLPLWRQSVSLVIGISSPPSRLRFIDSGELESRDEEDVVIVKWDWETRQGSMATCSFNASPPFSRGMVPSNTMFTGVPRYR
uniref:Uncharacterized protein n=1 Tax=Zea mays TaxID=4577 RepID=C0PL30_MAIZE|nr:unknown [Zea mays]